MKVTMWALLGYIAWTAILVFVIPSWRAWLTLSGTRRSNSFSPSGADISPQFERLCRAHANCYENFPIFGGLLILALVTEMTHVTEGLAMYLLAARVVQSSVHIASTSEMMVNLRFSLFYTQLVFAFIWIFGFIKEWVVW